MVFALASELPHFLFFRPYYSHGVYQWNIGFLLLLLFLLMMGYQLMAHWNAGKYVRWMLYVALFASACVLARSLPLDYSYPAVLLCTLFYALRNPFTKSVLGFFALGIRSRYTIGYLLPYLLLLCYNGKPGSGRYKYFFYFFYPLHLLVLWGIYLLG